MTVCPPYFYNYNNYNNERVVTENSIQLTNAIDFFSSEIHKIFAYIIANKCKNLAEKNSFLEKIPVVFPDDDDLGSRYEYQSCIEEMLSLIKDINTVAESIPISTRINQGIQERLRPFAEKAKEITIKIIEIFVNSLDPSKDRDLINRLRDKEKIILEEIDTALDQIQDDQFIGINFQNLINKFQDVFRLVAAVFTAIPPHFEYGEILEGSLASWTKQSVVDSDLLSRSNDPVVRSQKEVNRDLFFISIFSSFQLFNACLYTNDDLASVDALVLTRYLPISGWLGMGIINGLMIKEMVKLHGRDLSIRSAPTYFSNAYKLGIIYSAIVTILGNQIGFSFYTFMYPRATSYTVSTILTGLAIPMLGTCIGIGIRQLRLARHQLSDAQASMTNRLNQIFGILR